MNELLEIMESSASVVAEPKRKKICDLFNVLTKAVKARLVYPATSHLPRQFLEELFGAMSKYFETEKLLSLRVEADRVLYADVEVYRSQNKAENFAHVFFRDGILNIEFQRGITADELTTLVEILSRMMRAAYADDDLATLLWEASFQHISYKLMDDVLNIETFEYGIEAIKTGPGPGKSDIQKLYDEEINLQLSDEDFEITTEAGRRPKMAGAYAQAPDPVGDFLRKLMVFSDEEKTLLEEMLSNERVFDSKTYLINLLFEILGLEKDNAGYHEVLEIIGKVRDDFIKTGDFLAAGVIFTRVRELEEGFKNLKDIKLDKIQGFIEGFGSAQSVKKIVQALNRQIESDNAQVVEYLKLLPWQAIPYLVDALGDLLHFAGRRAICKALVSLAANKIELLSKGIDDDRWFVVRNIVMVLGQINSPKALSYFRRTIRHSELRVRKETVISAARIGSEEANDFLIMALGDTDERLQIMALHELINQRVVKAYVPIERIVNDKKFRDRSADQIKDYLEAMAKLGGSRAFEPLKKIATQISILSSEKIDRMKNYAIRALGFIQTPDSSALLDKFANGKNAVLADTARRALNKKLGSN